MKKYIIYLLLLSLLFSCKKDKTEPTFDSPEWRTSIGSRTDLPFFPDGNSNYFSYTFTREPGDGSYLQLEGAYPNARYMAVTVYDNETRDPVAHISDATLASTDAVYLPFSFRPNAGQAYQLNIRPEGNAPTGKTVVFPDSLTTVSVFLRYYLPLEDELGGQALPTIAAFDQDGTRKEAPAAIDITTTYEDADILDRIEPLKSLIFAVETDTDRHFFRPTANATGTFANPDNEYLISAVTLGTDEVVLLRWKAPIVGEDNNTFGAEMRYFSMSIEDEATFNYQTLSDEDLYVAADGYINLVLARNDAAVIDKANGLNFMAWPTKIDSRAMLIYRNMVTDPTIAHTIAACTPVSDNPLAVLNDPAAYDAASFIGEYAPQGKRMSKADFLADYGGIGVSF